MHHEAIQHAYYTKKYPAQVLGTDGNRIEKLYQYCIQVCGEKLSTQPIAVTNFHEAI